MTNSVAFTITGAFLTGHIQNLVLEGNYLGALEILKSSDSSQKDETLYKILSGDYILDGENDDIFINRNPEDEILREYKLKIASVISNYKMMFGCKLFKARGFVPSDKLLGKRYSTERVRFYKTSPKDIHQCIEDKVVFFEESSIQLPDFLLKEIREGTSFDLTSVSEIIIDDEDLVHIAKKNLISNDALYEEIELRKAQKEKDFLSQKRDEIIEQAKENGGFFEWHYHSILYRIPLSPFLEWVKSANSLTLSLEDLNPYEWESVLQPGWKMRSDDTNHSDWMLGAGFDFDLSYNPDFSAAVTKLKFKKLNEYIDTIGKERLNCLTINGKGIIMGEIKFFSKHESYTSDDIVVIPNSDIKYFELAKKVRCVIAKIGGPLSHLALNAKENQVNAILFPDAAKLELGILTRIDLSKMTIVQGRNKYERSE